MKLKKLNSLAWVAGMALTFANLEARERVVPIGSQAEKLTFKDIHYLPRTLDDYAQAKAYVLAFTTTGCPLVERYLPRLKELSAQYRDKGVQFIAPGAAERRHPVALEEPLHQGKPEPAAPTADDRHRLGRGRGRRPCRGLRG